MYCENCGARIDDDSRFCENCGALVAESEAEAFEEDAQELTDLDQLMEMGEEKEKSAEQPVSDQTMVFVKSERRTAEDTSHPKSDKTPAYGMEAQEETEENDEADKGQQEVSYGLSDDDIEIPDALKPEGDTPLFWPAQPERGSWDAEDEWEEESDWKEEQPASVFNEEEAPSQQPEMERMDFDTPIENPDMQEDEISEEESVRDDGFFGKMGLGAALKSRFLAGQEEEPVEEEERNEEHEARESEDSSVLGEQNEEQEDVPLFCMACGRQLPRGAAFCDACGTPTGEVSPEPPRRKRMEPGILPGILRHIFTEPVKTIERAASEAAFMAGIGFFILKDVVLAVLAAVLMGRFTVALGIENSWIAGGDPFGFGAKVFLCGILADAVWIALLYGAGRLFRGECSLKELTGACGTANIFAAILLLIAVILLAVFRPAGICAAIVAAAVFVICMTKALEAALDVDRERRFYLIAAATALYLILTFLAAAVLF